MSELESNFFNEKQTGGEQERYDDHIKLDCSPDVLFDILGDINKLSELAGHLSEVYNNRPKIDSFVGAMAGTKFAGEYLPEAVERDKQYVEDIHAKIQEDNSSFGQKNLDHIENNFQLSEILQAMIVDRMNKHWFKDCEAIMTTEYDDLRGIDAVMKHKSGGYLGTSFDFTVASKSTVIYNKLEREWENNVVNGKIQTVKYFEDPDTKQKGRLLVPKFIIGASKKDVADLASAYLNSDQKMLDNHPFKYLMLLQIETQLQTVLDYYETKKGDRRFDFARDKFNQIQGLLRNMRQEINLEGHIKGAEMIDYLSNSIALSMMNNFRVMRDLNPHDKK